MINLIHGDCLELMKSIPDKSIDMVLTDPPYGTTQCKWDIIIPLKEMWDELNRITKENAAVLLFGNEPFSSHLRLSNLNNYKYDWYWNTVNKITNHLNAKKQPMRQIETISVFYRKQPTYNPQKREGSYKVRKKNYIQAEHYGKMVNGGYDYGSTVEGLMPVDNIFFDARNTIKSQQFHPTQKPVNILEYLISTYSLDSQVVLDFTMGSGSTGVACKNLNRKFIGIEKNDKYYEIAKDRIKGA